MIRPIAALAVFAVLTGAVVAQEAAPAAPAAAPATAPDIVIDPAASLNNSPKQANMLTGFYATQAVIELCAVAVEPSVVDGMAADRARLERSLGLDAASGEKAYVQVKADVEKTAPDCTDGSTDRLSVDAVTAIYKAQAAASGPGAAPAAAAAPAPAAPAQTPAPVAP